MSLWRNEFIPINEFTRPGIKRNHTRNLVWHYTANPGASAANHYRYFSNLRDRYASAHIFIDRNEAICIIPLDEIAYHAEQANPYSIGIELCIEQDGSFHPDTIAQAVAIGKVLNRMYGLTVSDQMRHYDVTGKICPKPWVDDAGAWTRFRDQLVEKKKGDIEKVELQTWQWKMLGDVLDGLYKKRVITDYTWAEKAYTGKLTQSELSWLTMIVLTRKGEEEAC